MSLPVTFESADFRISFFNMFLADAGMNSRPPQFKTASFQLLAHEADHFIFFQSKLYKYGFEGCSVFPGHFYYSVNIFDRQAHDMMAKFRKSCVVKTSSLRETAFFTVKKYE